MADKIPWYWKEPVKRDSADWAYVLALRMADRYIKGDKEMDKWLINFGKQKKDDSQKNLRQKELE